MHARTAADGKVSRARAGLTLKRNIGEVENPTGSDERTAAGWLQTETSTTVPCMHIVSSSLAFSAWGLS